MLRVLGLVVTIGLGDSLNPSTIGPALYVGSTDRAWLGVFQFTAAVFAVHFAVGAVIVLGPGELVLSLLHDLGHTAQHALEIAAGSAMVGIAAVMWHHRRRLARKDLPQPDPQGKSALLLGATIIAVELPTAFPYYAAITAVLGRTGGVADHLVLVGVYNLCFVLPLIAILATILLAGEKAEALLTRGREAAERRWPVVFAGLLLLVGIVLVLVGVLAVSAK